MEIRAMSVAAALSTFALLFTSTAHAIPIAASMDLTASSEVEGVVLTDVDSDAWGMPLSPLSISASVTVSDLTTSGAGRASWGSGGNSGLIIFNDYGWSSDPGSTGKHVALLQTNIDPDWSYTFISDVTGTFTMNFNVVGSGDTFGLWGWSIDWSGPGGGLLVSNANDPTANGVFSRAVVLGDLYTVSLRNNANIAADGGAPGSGSMDGVFEFNMSAAAIPEPGTLSLLGVGLLGLAAIRRRKAKSN